MARENDKPDEITTKDMRNMENKNETPMHKENGDFAKGHKKLGGRRVGTKNKNVLKAEAIVAGQVARLRESVKDAPDGESLRRQLGTFLYAHLSNKELNDLMECLTPIERANFLIQISKIVIPSQQSITADIHTESVNENIVLMLKELSRADV